MVIRVYVSGISGNKEVKKRQQRVLMILESKNIPCEIIDITEPGKESDKEFMQQNSKPRGDQKHPLPPQIFNDDEYCGDFVGFDLANENEKLLPFLKMAVPEPSPPPEPQEENDENNRQTESESEEEEEPKPTRPRPRPPVKVATDENQNDNGGGNDDENANKNQGGDESSENNEDGRHATTTDEIVASENHMASEEENLPVADEISSPASNVTEDTHEGDATTDNEEFEGGKSEEKNEEDAEMEVSEE